MRPIALYPSSANLKKGLVGAGFFFFLAYQAMVWSSDGDPLMMWMFLGIGGMYGARVARAYLMPKPSFEADAEGFSVMGKPKKPWDEFRGASVRTVRYGFFPIARIVVVKTGKSILGRRVQITSMYQSQAARDMAEEIAAYGKHASRRADLTDAFGGADPVLRANPEPAVDGVLRGARKVAPRPAFGEQTGPIQAQPKLSERLFGRGKVI